MAAGETLGLLARRAAHHSAASLAAVAGMPASALPELASQCALDSLACFDVQQVLRKGTELCSGGQARSAPGSCNWQPRCVRRACCASPLRCAGVRDLEPGAHRGAAQEAAPQPEEAVLGAREPRLKRFCGRHGPRVRAAWHFGAQRRRGGAAGPRGPLCTRAQQAQAPGQGSGAQQQQHVRLSVEPAPLPSSSS